MPRERLYRWDDLFRRRRFRLVRGKHYGCSDLSMAQQVRSAAVGLGRVSIRETAKGLSVEFTPREETAGASARQSA